MSCVIKHVKDYCTHYIIAGVAFTVGGAIGYYICSWHKNPKIEFQDKAIQATEKVENIEIQTDKFIGVECIASQTEGLNVIEGEIVEPLWCPISQEIMTDPVMTPEGQTYERKVIVDWLEREDTDPLSRNQLDQSQLTTNYAIKKMIDNYKATRKCN